MADASLLITFLDMLGLAFLLAGIARFVAAGHDRSPSSLPRQPLDQDEVPRATRRVSLSAERVGRGRSMQKAGRSRGLPAAPKKPPPFL
jgi:hypothetical protein